MWIVFQVQPTILLRWMCGLGLSLEDPPLNHFSALQPLEVSNPVYRLWFFSHLLKRPFHSWPWSLLQDVGLISFHRLWPRKNLDNSCWSRSSSISLCWGHSHDPPGLIKFTWTWINWWRSTQLFTCPYDDRHYFTLSCLFLKREDRVPQKRCWRDEDLPSFCDNKAM